MEVEGSYLKQIIDKKDTPQKIYKYIPQIPRKKKYGKQKIGKEPGFVDAKKEETQSCTLMPKIGAQMNSKFDETSSIVSISKSAF